MIMSNTDNTDGNLVVALGLIDTFEAGDVDRSTAT
jgi:hypothetical protein